MKVHATYAIVAVLTVIGAITISPVFGQMEACPGCANQDTRQKAQAIAMGEIPISVWTDKKVYDHNSMIMVKGMVANKKSGFPVTLKVTGPNNNLVLVSQLEVMDDRSFGATINTGSSLMKLDGTYIIRVQHGSQGINNKVLVQLTGGEAGVGQPSRACQPNEVSFSGNCVPVSITGGSVTGASIDTKTKSMKVRIMSSEDGSITLTPSSSVISGIFMVLVDGQEWDDVEINGNQVTVMFPAGTEQIEIIGTFVIPEFGAIAALILAVAIISIIAVSAKTRLSIMPKY